MSRALRDRESYFTRAEILRPPGPTRRTVRELIPVTGSENRIAIRGLRETPFLPSPGERPLIVGGVKSFETSALTAWPSLVKSQSPIAWENPSWRTSALISTPVIREKRRGL